MKEALDFMSSNFSDLIFYTGKSVQESNDITKYVFQYHEQSKTNLLIGFLDNDTVLLEYDDENFSHHQIYSLKELGSIRYFLRVQILQNQNIKLYNFINTNFSDILFNGVYSIGEDDKSYFFFSFSKDKNKEEITRPVIANLEEDTLSLTYHFIGSIDDHFTRDPHLPLKETKTFNIQDLEDIRNFLNTIQNY